MDNAHFAHMLVRYLVAILATALALGIGVQAWRRRQFGLGCLAGWVATVAGAAWIITQAVSRGDPSLPLKALLMSSLNLLAGPLLLAYVLHALHQHRLHWLALAPFVLHALVASVMGVAIHGWISVTGTIYIEFAFTTAAWILYVYAARTGDERWPALPVLGVLVAVSTIHLMQALNMAGLVSRLFGTQVMLIIVGLWCAAAIGLSMIHSPVLRAFVPALMPAADAADAALFARIEQAMRERRLWTDPGLELGALAELLGTNANAVSRALSRAGNTTFYDYLNGYRVREAERLLQDPVEARYKIEALGLQAGFRARSTFFKTFRAHTGLTPSEFRRARNPAVAAD